MQPNARTHSLAIATMLAASWLLLTMQSAAAHAGHAHSDGGLGGATVLQVAGTAAALGLVYLLASRVYRHRETSSDTDGNERDTGSSP